MLTSFLCETFTVSETNVAAPFTLTELVMFHWKCDKSPP